MKSLMIIFLACFLFWGGYRIVKNVQSEQGYIGYLERAANANSVEMAKTELNKAITEIEQRELTDGYTSVLYKTPDEDIGFWYKNLKTSLAELQALPDNSSPLEQSNMLIKLRETLLDGDTENNVTFPEGISVYPHNKIVAWWGIVSALLTCLFLIPLVKEDKNS